MRAGRFAYAADGCQLDAMASFRCRAGRRNSDNDPPANQARGGIRAKPDNLSVAQRTHVSDLPPSSVLPQPFEPLGGKLGVAHRVLDVLVSEVGLQSPGVRAPVRQLKAAGVAKHMRAHRKLEACRHAQPRYYGSLPW